MYRNRHRCPTYPALALMLGGLLALTGAWGQVGNQPRFTTTAVPTMGRALIKLRVEQPTLMVLGTATAPTYLYQPAGRFQIQTAPTAPDGGNPTRTGDENRLLASVATAYADAAWGYEYNSKITVAIDADPADQTIGVFHDPHWLSADLDEESDRANLINLWPLVPTAGVRDVAGEFQVPVVEDATTTTSEWIRVRQVLTVVGDVVQFEFIVTNESAERHTVGLRLLIDAGFGGGTTLDGQTVVLPNGSTFETERTVPDATTSIMPDRWVAYDDPASPNVAVRGVLNTSEVFDPGIANSAGGLPDYVSWGQMRNIGGALRYYPNTNTRAPLVGEDWAYAVYWAPHLLSPGESRRYVTYYGLGSSAGDYEPPYALMAYGPFSLISHAGNDPNTPDVTEQYYLTDEASRSPFPLSLYMDNFGTSPIYDASGRVRLPLGLDLATGETATKSAGIIQRNEIKSLTWNVFATAARPGQADVKFTGPRGKVVNRTINIPAVPVLNPLPNATLGLEMVSVPYEFGNSDAEWVFQSLGSLLPGGPAALIRYDPQIGDYRYFPDAAVTAVAPGAGFWLLNRNREVIYLPNDATPVDPSRTYATNLKAGWNQIGNPFTTTVRLDQVRVAGSAGGEWSLAEAVSRNMLVPVIYAYDPEANEYTWELTAADSHLDPYMGYWLLTREDLTLLFPPPTLYTPAAAPVAASAPEPAGPNNWKVDLRVMASGLKTTTQSLAARTNATRGLDQYDVPKPPAGVKQEAVYLRSALYSGESALGMPYLVDTRDANERQQQYNLVVQTNAINTAVTVSWPSLESLPNDLVATLVDEVAGQRRYMRTTTSYTFRTGDAASERVLKVVVQPRPEGGLALTSVRAAQTGMGVAVSYALSSEAAVDVRVRNIAGVVVSDVALDRLSPAGQNTVLWSGRSNRGNLVPSGRYLCEITARSPVTGQSLSVVQPLEMRR
ncbi:MAG: hypothetical protein KKI08_07815 [Armatimonadetes bacterium]|nr:hypothetical protein [Armatimonadota bacterium]